MHQRPSEPLLLTSLALPAPQILLFPGAHFPKRGLGRPILYPTLSNMPLSRTGTHLQYSLFPRRV